MTREEAKELLPVIQAYIEGKTIQEKVARDKWGDIVGNINFNNYAPSGLRIKPETKYRPFKNAEECWQEMQKHQPFGWVKKINEETYLQVTKISGDNACIFRVNNVTYSAFDAHFLFDFADGTSFGIK